MRPARHLSTLRISRFNRASCVDMPASCVAWSGDSCSTDSASATNGVACLELPEFTSRAYMAACIRTSHARRSSLRQHGRVRMGRLAEAKRARTICW